MFNLKAVAFAFNLTVVEAGAYKDVDGLTLTYRPVFDGLERKYATNVAPCSFVDAEDLFDSLVSYHEINLVPTITESMINLLVRLEKVQYDYKDYHLDELCAYLIQYEDKYSTHTYDEIRFYGMLRQDLVEESFRLGSEYSTLSAIYNIVDEIISARKEYVV